ncbi:hypothetical protein [Tenuibacillus multivorans]|uniref:Uncharacterized protein n=1 Tax=Tenuibacillus multivorans TaxID=237069 RepID=A0A1G9ZEE7_9BACI|nr:hypothetical protein [Tenuibacillus multivorans]SDN19772.1 hypothetical protein SAMN05216498_1666 [Tenuibacillus multivorans]
MRVLFLVVVCFFIFYLGMQTATVNQTNEAQTTIQNEADLQQSSISSDSFEEQHEAIVHADTEQSTSSFYSIAVFLEKFVKTVFSVVFQFLYRFSSMFF